jgi:DNA repair protein SbcC/Rad50
MSRAAAQVSLQAAQQQLVSCEAECAAAAGIETLRQSLQAQVAELARRKTVLVGDHVRLGEDLKARRERADHALRAAEESAAAARGRL